MDPSGAAVLDESRPDPSQRSPLPEPRNPRPLFYAGSPQEEDESTPAETATGEGAGAAGSSTGDPWTDPAFESPDESEPDSWTESPAGDKPPQLLSKRQLKETAEAAVHIGTGMVHTVAAKTPLQREAELYKADADDAKAIGHPLAEIAYRRGDVVGGKLSPDANNMIQAVLGVVGYFAKQVNKIGQIREIEAQAATGGVSHEQ